MENRHSKKFPYVHFERFCIRIPTLAIDCIKKLTSKTEILDKELIAKVREPLIQEAIFLASPAFYFQMEKWCNGEISNDIKAIKIKHTLLKYLIRMSHRCTPFGLFAGCGIGKIADKNSISLCNLNSFTKDTRFDMHILVSLASNFSKRITLKNQLKYYPNSTLYRLGDRYRYVEYTYDKKERVHSIESILFSPYLEAILDKAKNGAKIHELVNYLSRQEIDQSEATLFIDELIENQILISEIEPTVTGKDFLQIMKNKLSNLQNCDNEIKIVDTLLSFQKKLGTTNLKDLNLYKSVNDYILSMKIDFDPKFLLQTDIYPMFISNEIHKSILKKVQLGIWVLNKVHSQRRNSSLEKFVMDFSRRYNLQKISLLEVLDMESGIGYGNSQVEATPFIDNIKISSKTSESTKAPTTFELLLQQKLQNSITQGNDIIELTDYDLQGLNENWGNAPDTISIKAEIFIEGQRKIIFMDSAGAHAARLLARFASGNNDINEFVHEIVDKEKQLNPSHILAEIVHIPESRTGNILRRPHLRKHEIPCLGFSSLPINQQISLTDILISVEGTQIILSQKSTGNRILPRLSNAHNYNLNPLPVYQFLCDLQHQNQTSYSFYWGDFMNEIAYLPRVVYKDIILSKARWKIKKNNFEDFKRIFIDCKGSELVKNINSWKFQFSIPKQVQLVEGDNILIIDFDCIWSLQILYENVKNTKMLILQEVFKDEETIVNKRHKQHKSEFIFSFYNDLKFSQN